MKLRLLPQHFLLSQEHCYLNPSHECYFLGAYECAHDIGLRNRVLAFKGNHAEAIDEFAQMLRSTLLDVVEPDATFIPMPSSPSTHRALQTLLKKLGVADCREMLLLKDGHFRAHLGHRLPPRDLAEYIVVHNARRNPLPRSIVLVDDVLATGSHFRAAKRVLEGIFPGISVVGLFLSRACLQSRRAECKRCCVN